MSVHTALQVPPRGRNHMMTSQETLRAMTQRRNAKWGAQGTCLSSCDLFLWGYLKGRVYTHNRRLAMAPKVSWLVIMWFLPLGVPEGPCVHSQSAMCHGPQGLLTCHHAISSSGGTWRAVFTLTNSVIWTSWRMPSGKKCSRTINNCWPERWTISSGGLKTAFKRMVVT